MKIITSFLHRLIYCDVVQRKLLLNLILIVIFATMYQALYLYDDDNFHNNDVNFGDMIHFSLVTQYTIGYGDQYPISKLAKALTGIHILLTWLINLTVVSKDCKKI